MGTRRGNARNSPGLEEPARLTPRGAVHWLSGPYGRRRTLCGILDTRHWIAPYHTEDEVCRSCKVVLESQKKADAEEIAYQEKQRRAATERIHRQTEKDRTNRLKATRKRLGRTPGGRLPPSDPTPQNTNARACVRPDPTPYSLPLIDQVRNETIPQNHDRLSVEPLALLSEIGITLKVENDSILGLGGDVQE